MKVGVLLSGCGVFDGTEIHEAVSVLLALEQNNLEYICLAPDINQHHVLDHATGKEIDVTRNVLVESARIARGKVTSLEDLDLDMISSLVIPGGFGAAKNLSNWAFNGPDSRVNAEVESLIKHCIHNKKPIVGLCISPTVIAKSLEGSSIHPKLTIGSTKDPSEYDIKEIQDAISSLGAEIQEATINGICIDEKLKIITATCYIMEASVKQVYKNTKQAIDSLSEILKNN